MQRQPIFTNWGKSNWEKFEFPNTEEDWKIYEIHSEMAVQHFNEVGQCTEFALTELNFNLGLHPFSGKPYKISRWWIIYH